MAGAEKKKNNNTRSKRGSTPGRPKRKGNEYFDLGKVGRKTGITLEDKGIRDEHGLEPVEHIFSSPVRNADGTVESVMQESSGPDLDKTLTLRKTPRLPPPRASTPKHTNIGSPKRMSTGQRASRRHSVSLDLEGSPTRPRTQPPANRVLDFHDNTVYTSIETASPFKPKHALRRSMAGKDPFASPAKASSDAIVELDESVAKIDNDDDNAIPIVDDMPILAADDDNYYDAMPHQPSVEIEEVDVQAGAGQGSPAEARIARPRKSTDMADNSQLHDSPSNTRQSSTKKRDLSVLDDSAHAEGEQSLMDSQLSESGPSRKKQRGKQSKSKSKEVIIHHRDGEDETIDPALLAYGDQYEATSALDAALEPIPSTGNGNANGKSKKAKGKDKVPKERDPNRAMRPPGNTVKINESPSKLRNDRAGSRQSSVGPMNNYHLRATTPFEDAGERTSRYGRNLIQPLKYWANEARIYKRGEIEGIVRAEEVELLKAKRPRKKKGRKGRKGISKLEDIDEESETESVMADEWEEEVGVIAGMVANWDPETQMGVPEDLIREDLGFASSSIVTREVSGSDFKYAKILTLPFFGSGVVELPPNGCKRAKNSRRMQQCFFVHEGKVMVEVGAASVGETTQFAISRGGVWVVPRGNDYAITNESKTTTARIFFAQGCEVEALAGREMVDS